MQGIHRTRRIGGTVTVFSLTPPSPCSCRRITPHLHYSSNHDFFVKLGLVLVLLAEAFAFIRGYVTASTTLFLSPSEISAYRAVTDRMTQLTAFYEPLNWLAMGVEILIVICAVAAAATLHSTRHKGIHSAATIDVLLLFVPYYFLRVVYTYLTDRVLATLPSLFDAGTLETAAAVQAQFQREYGFWGTAAPDGVIIVFTLASLALFVGAWLTNKVVGVWPPTEAPVPPPRTPPAIEPSPILAPTAPVATPVTRVMPKKFCRYCGARIPRDSKFCEECGSKLV